MEIRVYTISGRRVITLQNGGAIEVSWDLKNADGDAVASGVYIWLATDVGGHQKVGRLAVIR